MTTHGFVLAGGLSRRMGVDKATALWQGRPLVVKALDVLSTCDHVTVIHRRPDALTSVLDDHVEVVVDVIVDDEGGEGPLDGLRTALRRSSSDLTVVLAVDLVGVTTALVGTLIEALEPSDFVAAAVGHSGQRQGLISVWRTTVARPIVDSWFAQGERSVHGLLSTIDVRWVDVDDDVLRNVNTPGDLAAE
ncbi:MAG: molybdenum cofactor guanylyltransferase [Actinomycetota bacterium]